MLLNRIRMLLLFSFAVLSVLGPTPSCSSNSICTNGIQQNATLDPDKSLCKADCECNNLKFRGKCTLGVCQSIARESCVDKRLSQDCIEPITRCKGTRQCSPPELQERLFWGNCRCPEPEKKIEPTPEKTTEPPKEQTKEIASAEPTQEPIKPDAGTETKPEVTPEGPTPDTSAISLCSDTTNSNCVVAGKCGTSGPPIEKNRTNARFKNPLRITPAWRKKSNGDLELTSIFVTDTGNNTIRNINFSDNYVFTFAGSGQQQTVDGTGTSASFNRPNGITVAPDGSLFVSEMAGHVIRQIKPNRVVTTLSGQPNTASFADDQDPLKARFNTPAGILFVGNGDDFLLIADSKNHVIRNIYIGKQTPGTQQVVSTFLGEGTRSGTDNGSPADVRFDTPSDIVQLYSTYYIADTENNCIRKFETGGSASVLAGKCGLPNTGKADGALLNARFNKPQGITVSNDGKIYVSDTGNNNIRRIDPEKRQVTTLSAAKFGDISLNSPVGIIATGNTNKLLVVDSGNHCIRLIDPR